jgi:hypothetical protein
MDEFVKSPQSRRVELRFDEVRGKAGIAHFR